MDVIIYACPNTDVSLQMKPLIIQVQNTVQ